MGRIHINLDDNLEEQLRKRRFFKKGDISKYIESLIRNDLKGGNGYDSRKKQEEKS